MSKKILVVLGLCLSLHLAAQSFEEQFRAFQQKATTSYSDFRNKVNADYAEFLREAWQTYQQTPAISRPQEQPVPPVIYEDDHQQDDQQLPVEVVPTPEPNPTPQPVAPIQENEQPTNQLAVTYQGTSFSFRVPRERFQLRAIDGDALASTWKKIATCSYDNLLYDCLQNKSKYSLCDWAYIGLIGALGQEIYGTSNEATFLQAYILTQSGYALRLAQSPSGKLLLLMGSQYQLYDISYYEIDGVNYYPLTETTGSIQISPATFQGEQPFSLAITTEQGLALQAQQTQLRKSNRGVAVESTINLNAIHFYDGYPTGQVDGKSGSRWATYANTPMEECVRQSLYPTLSQAIRDVPEQQAVSVLLNWVQTAFVYEYDDKVWGHDRAFFPSETLYYPYADCEDRAILFSRIVRDLLHLDVVLIYYPGHLATAVAFNQDVKGDYVQLNGKKYIVCDPTFIGAPIGKTMSNMDNQTATLIPLQND